MLATHSFFSLVFLGIDKIAFLKPKLQKINSCLRKTVMCVCVGEFTSGEPKSPYSNCLGLTSV